MDGRAFWVAIALWLAMTTAFLLWFDYASATAIFHPIKDLSGNILFQVPGYANTV